MLKSRSSTQATFFWALNYESHQWMQEMIKASLCIGCTESSNVITTPNVQMYVAWFAPRLSPIDISPWNTKCLSLLIHLFFFFYNNVLSISKAQTIKWCICIFNKSPVLRKRTAHSHLTQHQLTCAPSGCCKLAVSHWATSVLYF